jgi:hypothetical protein
MGGSYKILKNIGFYAVLDEYLVQILSEESSITIYELLHNKQNTFCVHSSMKNTDK